MSRVMAGSLAVALLVTGTAAAQGPMPLAAGADYRDGPGGLINRALLAAALKPVYSVRLVSDWPELGAGGACRNGGDEVIGGRLELTSGGTYAGTLRREATIRFCGTHGPATTICSVTLTSEGPVSARGSVEPFRDGWAPPVLTLHWAATAEGTRMTLVGDCEPAFTEPLRRLYLGAAHVIEFTLPVLGEGRRIDHLDEGWIVEVQ